MPVLQQEAQDEARQLLSTILGDRATSNDLPIDPIAIAQELGIQVFTASLEPRVSGALTNSPGQDPVIWLNASDHPHRQRFTCAHELGHYVRRTNNGDQQFEYVDFRGPMAGTGRDPEERYANAFAAELLMPAHLVEELSAHMGAVEMAYLFRVSSDAMQFRRTNLQRT
jgi:Zn-dependent peptidase ImmA (M78 family)